MLLPVAHILQKIQFSWDFVGLISTNMQNATLLFPKLLLENRTNFLLTIVT